MSEIVNDAITDQLLRIRRRAIETYMVTSTFNAEQGYAAHEYQSPICTAMEDFWTDHIATGQISGWQAYVHMGRPGKRVRARRSYFMIWQTESFAKQWIYDCFVALGGSMNTWLEREREMRGERKHERDMGERINVRENKCERKKCERRE